ncbi:MAG: sulfurtransferase complex subunit TusB [Sideroxydans sp.]|jgi:tRNA 2-thiouridine synthesizing protein B
MLHIINKSPMSSVALESCLNCATGGDILLIEDGVYAAVRGSAVEARVLGAIGQFKVHVLLPDLEARGLGDKIIEGVLPVDYAGFVDLAANNKNCQSWL